MDPTLVQTRLPDLPLVHRGKVRDLYEVGEHLLVVATDRVSAYDVVLHPGIPDKGRVLTSLSRFWFEQLADIVPNHLITSDVHEMPESVRAHAATLAGRSMLVHRLRMFPAECVVRGWLTGSGWRDYRATGEVCGHRLPSGLPESARLDEPLFTPATKAEVGHDENIDFDAFAARVGPRVAALLRGLSLAVYERARTLAAGRGILVADTKLEFGQDAQGRIVLADEVLTPDSSRFWAADQWQPGRPQEPLDKQIVRNWLDARGWDRQSPPPPLPPEVVGRLSATYREIHRRLTGRALGG